MNGKEILVDTNILIYLLNGDDDLEKLLKDKIIYISFITELELLGYPASNSAYQAKLQLVLSTCIILPLDNSIKKAYIKIKKQTKLKLADSIIAATAIVAGIPFITADKVFKSVTKLNLILYIK